MTFLERISRLCSDKNLTFYKLEKELGWGQSTISRWATSSPSADKLQKIADYFNVSVDYLLGREEIKKEPKGFPIGFENFKDELIKRDISEKDFENLTDEQKNSLFNVLKELIKGFKN